jgi:hypothetical protein
LVGDEPLEDVDDLLLACGCGIEFAAHLDKPVVHLVEALVDLGEALVDPGAQIDHVFSQGIEARRSGVAKVAKLAAELCYVAISGAGEDAGRRSILLACPYPPVELMPTRFRRLHASFKAVRFHADEPTAHAEEVQTFIFYDG